MQPELRIQSTVAKKPVVIIDGLEKVIKKDLEKHKILLTRSKLDLIAFREAVAYQVKKKRHYKSLVGGGKFNDAALQGSMAMIGIDLRHMSDRVKLAEEAIVHHSLTVDTLTVQLADQNKKLKILVESRGKECAVNN